MSDMLGLVFKEGPRTFSHCEHCEDTIFLRLHSRSYDKWSAHEANMGALMELPNPAPEGGRRLAEFIAILPSNTPVWKLIILKILLSWFRCVYSWRVGAELYRTVALRVQDWTPMIKLFYCNNVIFFN